MLLTEAAWIALHPIVNADGDPLKPTLRLPARPAELAGNACHAQVTIHAQRTKITDTALANATLLKNTVIKSSGVDIASETEDFDTGHLLVPTWTLYDHVIMEQKILLISHFSEMN